MNWDRGQLAALAAVVEHQTFEAAARALSITPSAVSQRIRALEAQLGQVAVTRSRPCRPTTAGAELVRLARELELLEAEADRRLGAGSGRVELAVVVNADSLATWFRGVLGAVADWSEATLRLYIEDQEFSSARLRSAEALAAVTSDPAPIQGCSVHSLGVMRYLPIAAPGLLERHRHERHHHERNGSERNRNDRRDDGTSADRPSAEWPSVEWPSVEWGALPMIRFDAKDQLQHDLLAAVAPDARPPVHWVPSSADCLAAVRLGLGWAMLPEAQLDASLDDGTLVRLAGSRHADVRLFWQRWRVGSESLDRLTDLVVGVARRELRAG